MPVGIQRLNAKKSQPNPHIVFIKPLKGPDQEVARQFLERIAAQCVPIMRDHHLSVMTLEEYEPNAEFVGRNFNAGEVVQLVLKARGGGPGFQRWLPFSYVQMVMMHELAHCRQMNHSRGFWSVRDAYAAHMRRLWAARYTGEGIWGRGAKLGTAADGGPPLYERNVAQPGGDDGDGVLLDHLCGGTYQSRGGRRKRKAKNAKPVLTYREREDRRIRRKFGVNGVALGDDLEERAKLDAPDNSSGGSNNTSRSKGGRKGKALGTVGTTKTDQKRLATKPRVAVSKRGRDLRAAAALARFEQNQAEKKEEEEEVKDEDEVDDAITTIKREGELVEVDLETDSDGTDDGEEYEDADPNQPELTGPDAVDIDGSRLLDGQGRGMVRVCEGENTEDDSDAKRELRELLQTASWGHKEQQQKKQQQKQQQKLPQQPDERETPSSSITRWAKPIEQSTPARTPDKILKREPATEADHQQGSRVKREPVKNEDTGVSLSSIPRAGSVADRQNPHAAPHPPPLPLPIASTPDANCPICSFAHGQPAITCAVCGHVLDADAVPGAWHCSSATCRASEGVRFLNAGDCGVCGVCGERRGSR